MNMDLDSETLHRLGGVTGIGWTTPVLGYVSVFVGYGVGISQSWLPIHSRLCTLAVSYSPQRSDSTSSLSGWTQSRRLGNNFGLRSVFTDCFYTPLSSCI